MLLRMSLDDELLSAPSLPELSEHRCELFLLCSLVLVDIVWNFFSSICESNSVDMSGKLFSSISLSNCRISNRP